MSDAQRVAQWKAWSEKEKKAIQARDGNFIYETPRAPQASATEILHEALRLNDISIWKPQLSSQVNSLNDYGRSWLVRCIGNGYATETIQELLKMKANINLAGPTAKPQYYQIKNRSLTDPDYGLYRTPLMTAAVAGNLPVCKLLLAAKANVLAKDIFNYTAHTLATQNKNLEVVALLERYGAQKQDMSTWRPV